MEINSNHVNIPDHLLRDKYWRSMLYLFLNHSKLKNYMQYIDLKNEVVNIARLKSISKPWSESEKFMLHLALHLFNSSIRVDLGEMEYLDKGNTELALKAIRLRYA